MTQRQLHDITIMRTLLGLLDPEAPPVKAIPLLLDGRARLLEYTARIDEAARLQATISKGKTDVKHELQEQMLAFAHKVRNAVLALASRNGATELLGRIPATESALNDLRDNEKIVACSNLLHDAEAHASDLAACGIGPDVLPAFGEAINSFGEAIGVRDTSVRHRGSMRLTLEELFAAVGKLLDKEMDPLIEVLRDSDPALHHSWFSARALRSSVGRHNAATPDGDVASPPAVAPVS